jgi:hypothetical protein
LASSPIPMSLGSSSDMASTALKHLPHVKEVWRCTL